MQARADLSTSMTPYRNATEQWWAHFGPALIEQEFGQKVVVALYEAMTLHLAGSNYTPDFYYVLADGREILVEIKGSRAQRNYRDARAKLRQAAETLWWWQFVEVRKSGNTFELERIRNGRI